MTKPTAASTCGACQHWRRPEERSGYGNAVSYRDDEWDDDADDGFGGPRRGSADDHLFGECLGVPEGWDLPNDGPAPLAATRDGSNYRAVLFTRAEFGCVLWEAQTVVAVEVPA
jgi:hypothetical protein